MNELDVSIIIPVYNAESHIPHCASNLAEIFRQRPSMEAIFIDDASTDSTLGLISHLQEETSYISICAAKKNGGPGDVRNLGMERAIGKYILFLDVDDAFYPQELSDLLDYALDIDADLVAFDADIEGVNGEKLQRKDLAIVEKGRDDRIRSFLRTDMDGSVIFTLFSRDFLATNRFSFPSGLHEDLPVIFKAYYLSDSIPVFRKPVYKKISYPSSIVHSITEAHIDGLFAAYNAILKLMRDDGRDIQDNADDVCYGVTGFVGALVLKIVYGQVSHEKKAVLGSRLIQIQ